MKPDIPLLNQSSRKADRLLTTQLIAHEAAGLMRAPLKFADLQRLHELRRSCGVEGDKTASVRVNVPPRHR